MVPASSADVQPRPEAQEKSQEDGQERQPRERRSRDRYGRDRRERADRTEQPAEGDASQVKAEFSESNQPPAHAEHAPAAIEAVAVTLPVLAAAPAVVVVPSPAPVAAPIPVPVAAVAPAAVAGILPKVQSYDLPMQDLVGVAEGSGLQWVNSDAGKIAEAQAAIAAEVKPVPVPRERPAAVISQEAPLVLVETKRDLGTLQLPFEGANR